MIQMTFHFSSTHVAHIMHVIGTVHVVCTAGSMKHYGVHPSVHLSIHLSACPVAAAEEQLESLVASNRTAVAQGQSTALSIKYGQCRIYSQGTWLNY